MVQYSFVITRPHDFNVLAQRVLFVVIMLTTRSRGDVSADNKNAGPIFTIATKKSGPVTL